MRRQDPVNNPEMAPHTDSQAVSLEILELSHLSNHTGSMSEPYRLQESALKIRLLIHQEGKLHWKVLREEASSDKDVCFFPTITTSLPLMQCAV